MCAMRPDFLDVKVGDVVTAKPHSEKAYLTEALYAEGGT